MLTIAFWAAIAALFVPRENKKIFGIAGIALVAASFLFHLLPVGYYFFDFYRTPIFSFFAKSNPITCLFSYSNIIVRIVSSVVTIGISAFALWSVNNGVNVRFASLAENKKSPCNVNFVEAIQLYAVNFKNFSGRSTRSEFWWAMLFVGIIITPFYLLATYAEIAAANYILIILAAVNFIPCLSLGVRRMHDTGRSGWWVLLSFIPLVGIVAVVLCSAQSGESNKWGQKADNSVTANDETKTGVSMSRSENPIAGEPVNDEKKADIPLAQAEKTIADDEDDADWQQKHERRRKYLRESVFGGIGSILLAWFLIGIAAFMVNANIFPEIVNKIMLGVLGVPGLLLFFGGLAGLIDSD